VALSNYFYSQNTLPAGVFAFAQGRLYFDNEDALLGRELWISEGTQATTRILKNIATETQTQPSTPADFVRFNNRLYFTANDGDFGKEVWYSDGTNAGTQMMADLRPGAVGSAPSDLFVAEGALYFFALDATGTSQLWKSDGTAAGTQSVRPMRPRPDNQRSSLCTSKGVALSGIVYIPAQVAAMQGMTLWRTDGTANGTSAVGPASVGVCGLMTAGSRLYFLSGLTGTGGVWMSDGTNTGTVAITAINSVMGSYSPRNLTAFNNKVYLLSGNGTGGAQLWTSDGTVAGTLVAASFGTGLPLDLQGTLNGKLVLGVREAVGGVTNVNVWTYDGATAAPLNVPASIQSGTVFINRALGYYSGQHTENGASKIEPWATDGTSTGTRRIFSTTTSVVSSSFTDFEGATVFQTSGAQPQWWKTVGSSAPVSLGNQVFGSLRQAANQNLFYVGNSGATGAELFALDNVRPVASADTVVSVESAAAATIGVTANDQDPDGTVDSASLAIAAQPTNGTVSVGANGQLTYRSNAGFVGSDSFTYTIADEQSYVSLPATVTVNVTAPPASGGGGGGGGGSGGGGGGGGAMGWATLLLLTGMLSVSRRNRRH